MKLGIYTIEKIVFEGNITELITKTVTGEISILANHIPLISRLVSGTVRIIEQSGEHKSFSIRSGFLEVKPENNIVILADV